MEYNAIKVMPYIQDTNIQIQYNNAKVMTFYLQYCIKVMENNAINVM